MALFAYYYAQYCTVSTLGECLISDPLAAIGSAATAVGKVPGYVASSSIVQTVSPAIYGAATAVGKVSGYVAASIQQCCEDSITGHLWLNNHD